MPHAKKTIPCYVHEYFRIRKENDPDDEKIFPCRTLSLPVGGVPPVLQEFCGLLKIR